MMTNGGRKRSPDQHNDLHHNPFRLISNTQPDQPSYAVPLLVNCVERPLDFIYKQI
ncbi:hypothetical protein BGW80DRAFT_1301522, partial [Lactifluus volemus]